MQAEAVVQAEVEQAAQRLAFRRGTQDLFAPALGIVHVAVVGRDVEVAEHDQVRMLAHFLAQPFAHRGEPAQLVLELLAAHGLAVDHIQVDDADGLRRIRGSGSADRGGEHALLRIVETGDRGDAFAGERQAADQGHAVVGLLPAEHAAIAQFGQRGVGELAVLELGFLQGDHVRREVLQPLLQVRQAHVERIDVPAGDFHGRQCNAAVFASGASRTIGA